MTETRNIDQTGNSKGASFFAILIVWATLAVISSLRYAPPGPIPKSAPDDVFSADRAEPILEDLVGDHIPHPVGSEQNRIVRERIVQWMTRFGYEVEIQESVATIHASFTDRRGDAGQETVDIYNIIARLKGKTDGPPVMLVAHYDSHPAGPGVSDDAVGTTAVLEIARMLKQEDQLERDVVFLITDGEEYGLLGAKRFMEEVDWADDVHSAINLEARGSKGPSLMFETGSQSLWAIQLYSRNARKPFASSLFFEIYQRLPNDTDFTVFKEHGLQGFNFAYIGNVKHYHTPEDNLENTERGCLQHHGENALALIREMANADLDSIPDGRAVYFDLYGWRVIWWPASATIWIAGFAAIMCVIATVQIQRFGKRPVSGFIQSTLALLTSLIAIGIALFLVNRCLQLDAVLDTRYPPYPALVSLTYWSTAIVIVAFASWWNPLKLNWSDALGAQLVLWPVLAVAITFVAQGASYLFVVPAIAMGVVCTPVSYSSKFLDLARQYRILLLTPPIIVGVIWLPMERLFYDAVGFGMFPVMALRLCLVSCTLLPVLLWAKKSSRLVILGFCGGLFVAFVIAATLMN